MATALQCYSFMQQVCIFVRSSFLSKDGLEQNPSIWAWLRRVAVVLNHLAPGTVLHSPPAKRATGTDKLVGRFTKQECHHTTRTWLHCLLSPRGCWLHAASCQLDALQWSHWDCQKLQAFFPFRHAGLSWLTAWSIPNSLGSPRPYLWPPDTGHSWRHLVTEFIQELGKPIPSVVPTSWVQRTESLKEKNLTKNGLKMKITIQHVILLRRMLWNLTENMARFSTWLCKQGPNTPFHYSNFILQPR